MGTEELIASGTQDRGDPGEDSLMYEVLLGRKSVLALQQAQFLHCKYCLNLYLIIASLSFKGLKRNKKQCLQQRNKT